MRKMNQYRHRRSNLHRIFVSETLDPSYSIR